jgi:hypothetical protein
MIALVGCGPSDPIRTYDVKREKDETPAVAAGPDKYRLLGAIIPAGEDSWFV